MSEEARDELIPTSHLTLTARARTPQLATTNHTNTAQLGGLEGAFCCYYFAV